METLCECSQSFYASFRGVSPQNLLEKTNCLREILRSFLRESSRLRIFVCRVNAKKELFSWADLYKTQWTFTMDSVDSLDNVHGHYGQSPVSPWTKSIETSQTGQYAWIQWTLSMESVDISMDPSSNVHGTISTVSMAGQSKCLLWSTVWKNS